MMIYGHKNYSDLVNVLIKIPGVAISATKYWKLPIYKVDIKYTD